MHNGNNLNGLIPTSLPRKAVSLSINRIEVDVLQLGCLLPAPEVLPLPCLLFLGWPIEQVRLFPSINCRLGVPLDLSRCFVEVLI